MFLKKGSAEPIIKVFVKEELTDEQKEAVKEAKEQALSTDEKLPKKSAS
jgi:hypothetical protein